MTTRLIKNESYLLLIDEEAEIKENTNTFKEGINGDWYWNSKYNFVSNNGDITAFDFKIIAYYPLTKEAKELELPWLPKPFKEQSRQFSLEDIKKAFRAGQKHGEDNACSAEIDLSPSEEVYIQSLSTQQLPVSFEPEYRYYYHSSKEFYSDAGFVECSKEQYESIKVEIPTCPLKVEIKTITNSEGKEEIQGKYKY